MFRYFIKHYSGVSEYFSRLTFTLGDWKKKKKQVAFLNVCGP